MKKYIGTKLIEAEPMTEINFMIEKTGKAPNGYKDREGFKVAYPDGYISWSPKDVFEEAYRSTNGMTFGLAIEAIKKGFKVARKGWNGKGMYVRSSVLCTPNGDEIANTCLLLYNVQVHYNTWVPSITDIFGEDWYIVE